MEARKLTSKENEAYEYSFSMFIPTNFPIVPTRLVIAQWKQYCPKDGNCSDDSPVLAIRYISGVLKITQDIGKHKRLFFKSRGRVSRPMARFQISNPVFDERKRTNQGVARR